MRQTTRTPPRLALWLIVAPSAIAGTLAPPTAATRNAATMTHTATKPTHTNRLIHATSPYLLQHAHNPVDWYPWGPEALDRARREDKPIFLSIGYAACHWCHVMERESFENEEVAAILNASFVSIKVDREERPDLDDIYMKATVLYNQGGGGWPMSAFLMPDGKPFFAGTYFPPEDRWGRPGFKNLLGTISRLWKDDRDKVKQGANSLSDAVRQYSAVEKSDTAIGRDQVERAVNLLAKAFDRDLGGMSGGGSNKFPPSMAMDLMLREYHYTASEGKPRKELLELVETTLDHMANGGIYDQLGGGIARYSTDEKWLVPHFEKMLYDQALVSGIFLDAYQVTKKPLYARIVREVLEYVIADLQSPEGGFYSTRDADSEGVEGKYYVWSRDEIERLLGPDAELLCSYYDVSRDGNWEGHNILHVPRPADIVAKLNKVSIDELEKRLAESRKKLLDARSGRVPPHLDDKILASWNGLMIANMARGGAILGEPKFTTAAGRAAEFVLKSLRDARGRLLRTYRAGKAHTLAYLDDHAFMIEAMLNLYEATHEVRWLDEAERMTKEVEQHFADREHGGYFFTPNDGEALLVRSKDASDSAIPSGNSVHLMNLLRLSVLLDDKALAAEAEKLMKCFGESVQRSPHNSERLLAAVDFYHLRPREIALVYPPGRSGMAVLEAVLWQTYLPNKVVAYLPSGTHAAEKLAKRIPLLADRQPLGGKATAYVCRNFTCQMPTNDPKVFAEQLAKK